MQQQPLTLTISQSTGEGNDYYHVTLSHERLTLRVVSITLAERGYSGTDGTHTESRYDVTLNLLLGVHANTIDSAKIVLRLPESSVPRVGSIVTLSLGALPPEFVITPRTDA